MLTATSTSVGFPVLCWHYLPCVCRLVFTVFCMELQQSLMGPLTSRWTEMVKVRCVMMVEGMVVREVVCVIEWVCTSAEEWYVMEGCQGKTGGRFPSFWHHGYAVRSSPTTYWWKKLHTPFVPPHTPSTSRSRGLFESTTQPNESKQKIKPSE